MAHKREADGRQQTRGHAGPTGGTVVEGESPKSEDRGRRPSEDIIKAVSGLLSAKKTAFNRPSTQFQFTLPAVSRSLGEVSQRLKAPPSPRADFELPRTSLDAPPMRLPDGGPVEGHGSVEPASVEMSGIEPPAGPDASPMVGANGGSTSTVRDFPPPISAVAKPFDPMPGISPSQGDRNPRHRESGAAEGIVPQSDSIRAGAKVEHPAFSAPSRTLAVDLPQESEGASRTSESQHSIDVPDLGPSASGSGTTLDRPHTMAGRIESPMSFIRNPLSADLRNRSMASPALPESRGNPSSHGGGMGISADQNAFGSTTSPQGGSSIDLSKTNELLQQLVDAVRKQRGSSLPIGGPSVSSDR